ncbi:MAG: LamG domain-containing protein [Candidatus Micrarchaeota archaeon]
MKTFRKSFIKKKLLGKASVKKPSGKASAKAQSAMEYLMTYGWAILIISVVLAALFQLGVFNPMTFAPKAPPGSCQVFRPNGPYTTQFINLEGICSGELPQYVASFRGVTNSYITTSLPTLQTDNTTISAWFMPQNPYPGAGAVYYLGSAPPYPNSNGYGIVAVNAYNGWCSSTPHPYMDFLASSIYGFCFTNAQFNIGSWNYVALVLTPNGSNRDATLYLNGVRYVITNLPAPKVPQYNALIGSSIENNNFHGQIANVQIYNTSLSANEIQALYLEGIGGAPINLQHLVGWWPLNGNANDYSGNGYNGQAYNVTFVSNWYSGYTPP